MSIFDKEKNDMKGITNATKGSADVIQDASKVQILDMEIQSATDSQPGIMTAADHQSLTATATRAGACFNGASYDDSTGKLTFTTADGQTNEVGPIGGAQSLQLTETDSGSLYSSTLFDYLSTLKVGAIATIYFTGAKTTSCSGTLTGVIKNVYANQIIFTYLGGSIFLNDAVKSIGSVNINLPPRFKFRKSGSDFTLSLDYITDGNSSTTLDLSIPGDVSGFTIASFN